MAYPPKAKAALARQHQNEHLEIMASMATAAFANSGLSEEQVAAGSVRIALAIQKEINDQSNK